MVEDRDLSALELPDEDSPLAMVVVLPRRPGDFPEVEESCDAARLAGLLARLDASAARKVEVFLPRFRMEATFGLCGALQALGARRAFDPHADFSGMADVPEGLWNQHVLHAPSWR